MWTEKEFFKALSKNVEPDVVDIVRNLYEWSKDEADIVSLLSFIFL